MVELAATVWRDFVTDGVPSSGTWKPHKSDVRKWGAYLEALHVGSGLSFVFSSITADADPGAGTFRLNNASLGSVTAAYVDNVDSTGITVGSIIDGWDDSTNNVRGTLTVRGVDNASVVNVFNVTGSVIDGTGYRKLTVVYVGGSGALVNGDIYALIFTRSGDANVALPGFDTNNFAGASESARIAAMFASNPAQPYVYKSPSHFGIIRDTAPLNYQGTRAAFVLQRRDTAAGGTNELIPGTVFAHVSTGDGVVTAGSDLSQSIWMGLTATMTKTGDGSGSTFQAIGELGAYGVGTYNELGGFVGEFTNTGSLHGTMSGVEVLVKDGIDNASNFDTTMSGVIARIRRWNGGTRRVVNFMASSEGDVGPESAYSFSPGGYATWLRGMDFRYATFTTGQAILLKNADSIAAMNAAGSNAAPLMFLDASDHTWLMAGGTGKSLKFANSALAVQFNILSTASAVNNFEASGAVAGQSPLFWVKGTDTDIGASFGTKGAGVHNFYTGGATFLKQAEIGHVASAVNFVSLKGAVTTGHPIVQPGGTDTNPSLIVQGKGTGGVKVNDGGAATKFEVNTTGIGFFGTTPVAAKTGWGVPTGTFTRTTYVTSTVTLPQLAERVAALIQDFHQTAGYGALRS